MVVAFIDLFVRYQCKDLQWSLPCVPRSVRHNGELLLGVGGLF